MQTTVTLPNGQVMTVSELSANEVQGSVQDITLQLLGVTLPAAGASAVAIDAVYRQVRVDWPQEGQPTWKPTEDVCFIEATPETMPNLLTRNTRTTVTDGVAAITQEYGRGWTVRWTFYGPNSGSRSGLVHSALLRSFALWSFQAAGLYIITSFALPVRAPELFNAQWWDRYDLTVRFSEAVTSTITTGTVQTVPISISAAGQTITTQASTATKG